MTQPKKILVNKEAYHAEHFAHAVAFAWQVEGPACEAAIVEPIFADRPIDMLKSPEEQLVDGVFSDADDVGPDYSCMRRFSLPANARMILTTMALGTRIMPLELHGIKGLDCGFSYETFSLGNLLETAYPRNTRTGIIKGTLGAMYMAGGWEKDDDAAILGDDGFAEYEMHRQYAGIGTIIMGEARYALGEHLTDDEVVTISDEKELLITVLADED